MGIELMYKKFKILLIIIICTELCACLRFQTKTLNMDTLDFGPYPREYRVIVYSHVNRNIGDIVSRDILSDPPEKGVAKTQSLFEKIMGDDAYYGWSGLVRVVTYKKEYVVVGKHWVRTKNGGFWADTLSDKPVITGKIDSMYKYYIRDNEVVGLEPLK